MGLRCIQGEFGGLCSLRESPGKDTCRMKSFKARTLELMCFHLEGLCLNLPIFTQLTFLSFQFLSTKRMEFTGFYDRRYRVRSLQVFETSLIFLQTHLLLPSINHRMLSTVLQSIMKEGFDVKALRAFRVLRPLRLVSGVPSEFSC
jgi:hypothetical protein